MKLDSAPWNLIFFLNAFGVVVLDLWLLAQVSSTTDMKKNFKKFIWNLWLKHNHSALKLQVLNYLFPYVLKFVVVKIQTAFIYMYLQIRFFPGPCSELKYIQIHFHLWLFSAIHRCNPRQTVQLKSIQTISNLCVDIWSITNASGSIYTWNLFGKSNNKRPYCSNASLLSCCCY
jgi:hypothetical protein